MAIVRIFLTGRIQGNSEIEWRISPPPEPTPTDADLQRITQEGEQTEDYANDIEDRMFWAKGEW